MSNKTWYQIKAKADKPKSADISIHDEIGLWGISASQFMRDLRSMGELDEIRLSIHSPGGDVLDGWAIYNALKSNKARVIARVEGLAASMASVILMAADTVEIPENAYVMIHNPWGFAVGDAEEMRETADLLDKLQNGLVRAYAGRTKQEENSIRKWMDDETWMDGKEAVERGFADVLLDGVAMSARAFDTRKFKMTPTSLQANSEAPQEVAPTEETPTPAPVEETPVEAVDSQAPVEQSAVESPGEGKGLVARLKAFFAGEPTIAMEGDVVALSEFQDVKNRLDAALAKLTALEPKAKAYDEAQAEIERLEAERQTAEAKAAAQVASLGFTPESEKGLPDAEADKGDILATFESLTGAAKTAFYRANKKAILHAQSQS